MCVDDFASIMEKAKNIIFCETTIFFILAGLVPKRLDELCELAAEPKENEVDDAAFDCCIRLKRPPPPEVAGPLASNTELPLLAEEALRNTEAGLRLCR
ncbi:hypothetical protein WUBG_12910 [Wuchereria bancrofti]|uniref:Uncharacterized protein n=1 Tax=Wuchereria bancrofti TaxID=6293 RepID=J9E216_WUCBA|nr:hypothetical protein WUBG_12910 [Wuchereria bancrofti]